MKKSSPVKSSKENHSVKEGEDEDEMSSSASKGKIHPIMGFNVHFPADKRPFAAQFAVMSKILTALKRKQHALLESPTGSGKTLALLCSTLSWQMVEMDRLKTEEILKLEEEQNNITLKKTGAGQKKKPAMIMINHDGEMEKKGGSDSDDFEDIILVQKHIKSERAIKGKCSQKMKNEAAPSPTKLETASSEMNEPLDVPRPKKRVLPQSLAEVMHQQELSETHNVTEETSATQSKVENTPSAIEEPLKKKRKLPLSIAEVVKQHESTSPLFENENKAVIEDGGGGWIERKLAPSLHMSKQEIEQKAQAHAAKMLPTIYFASRTHSQITQIVNEFRNCPEAFFEHAGKNEKKMTILGSKSHYCINPSAKRSKKNLNDACQDLLDANSCSFKKNIPENAASSNWSNTFAPEVYDIEELVEIGKEQRVCPYFFSRTMAEKANIVFCPYNYLINPNIRSAMDISLDDAIVVLDEAHNIEDICRESASLDLSMETIKDAYVAFDNGCERTGTKHSSSAHSRIRQVLKGFQNWLVWASTRTKATGFQSESAFWSGSEALEFFESYSNITVDNFHLLTECVTEVRTFEQEMKKDPRNKDPTIPEAAQQVASNLMTVINFMLRYNQRNLNDYKLVVQKSKPWSSSYSSRTPLNKWTCHMCLWCLNPQVAFEDISKLARCVVLTSGTLSPMNSFANELGVLFPIRLEANHVINTREQVWVGAIATGPGLVDMTANYRNQQSLSYQDSLGSVIIDYAQITPGGMLVFLPSYSFLDKLMERWKATNRYKQLQTHKRIFLEPKSAGETFDEELEAYREVIRNTRNSSTTVTGAIFFAIFRGKISEGIDFSDDYARAVLVVGIPFPNVKDLKVGLKKTYQDQQQQICTSNQMKKLDGNMWYSNLAFRALNQALGRCLRHRLDYGAIILLDTRFGAGNNTQNLSKWMRGSVQHYHNSEDSMQSLRNFFHKCQSNPDYVPKKEKFPVKNTSKNSQKGGIALEYENNDESNGGHQGENNWMSTKKRNSAPSSGVFKRFRRPGPAPTEKTTKSKMFIHQFFPPSSSAPK